MRKIGELKGKPIVEGNPNELKNNQIHAKTEGGGITLSERKNGSLETISGGSSSSGGSSKYVTKYYNIEKDVSGEMKNFIGSFASTIKQVYNGYTRINPMMFINNPDLTLIGFSFNPIHTNIIEVDVYIDSIEDLCAFLEGEESDLLLQSIKRITEEEYYKID